MTGISGNLCSCLKEDKPPVLYDGERGIALDPIQECRASSQVDLAYPEQFHISLVISVSFYTCEVVRGDSLEYHQANHSSLRV